ncbi:MAG: protein jag [Clostridiales bacterium]|nr:protein jag [Clostridiales bacterium]
MKSIESIGKTVEEAVQKGLEQLDLSIAEAQIDILDEGTKGVLGLLGVKMAKVRVSEKFSPANKAISFLTKVSEYMSISDPGIAIAEDDRTIKIRVEGRHVGAMIGHRGETLDALQLLTSLVVNHQGGESEDSYFRVQLDVGGYRKKREKTLEDLAERLAEKALNTGRNVALDPMNSYERRIVHTILSETEGISTYSEGVDPKRRVVITIE